MEFKRGDVVVSSLSKMKYTVLSFEEVGGSGYLWLLYDGGDQPLTYPAKYFTLVPKKFEIGKRYRYRTTNDAVVWEVIAIRDDRAILYNISSHYPSWANLNDREKFIEEED